jgi:tripeptide aminopeptidase
MAVGGDVMNTWISNLIRRTVRSVLIGAVTTMAVPLPAIAQQPDDVERLLENRAVKAALESARTSETQTIADQIRFCEVPAPPFKETARAEELARVFKQVGLRNVRIDGAGNVLGDRPGAAQRPRLVIAAHLDTVFPVETNVKVSRVGTQLRGPGIGDNCRGLAVLVATARALEQSRVQTPGTMTFVANVGEEGLGDLRGVKALFGESLKGQIDRFVSIDGGGLHITNIAVGSHRYRVAFNGPGGHSFGSFGRPNPAHALGRAAAKIADIQVPNQPKTTFNIGRIGGGTSVNSIPFEAWMEVDMRSSDRAALAALDAQFQAAVDSAVTEENARWGRLGGAVTVQKELVGDRPAGSTPDASAIVRTAQAVGQALGVALVLAEGSTDSNIPMSMKIPAITIGAGGRGSDAHALTESFDTVDSWMGTQNAVLLAIALAQK